MPSSTGLQTTSGAHAMYVVCPPFVPDGPKPEDVEIATAPAVGCSHGSLKEA